MDALTVMPEDDLLGMKAAMSEFPPVMFLSVWGPAKMMENGLSYRATEEK